jgi:hypothetical protein
MDVDNTYLFNLIEEKSYDEAIKILYSRAYKNPDDLFREWWNTKTPEELKLWQRALDFEEEYFNDMTLKDYEDELFTVTDLETGEKFCSGDMLIQMEIRRWHFKIIQDSGGLEGCCNTSEHLIEIVESHIDNDITLLHEMTHAYEALLAEHPGGNYSEFVLLKLFDKLRVQMPNIWEYISTDSHSELAHNFFDGLHSTLFLLKTLDLDLLLGKPLEHSMDIIGIITLKLKNKPITQV